MESYLECFETTKEELKLYWMLTEDEDITDLNQKYKSIFVEYFGFIPHFKNPLHFSKNIIQEINGNKPLISV